jgi:hypothetical protein
MFDTKLKQTKRYYNTILIERFIYLETNKGVR